MILWANPYTIETMKNSESREFMGVISHFNHMTFINFY